MPFFSFFFLSLNYFVTLVGCGGQLVGWSEKDLEMLLMDQKSVDHHLRCIKQNIDKGMNYLLDQLMQDDARYSFRQ